MDRKAIFAWLVLHVAVSKYFLYMHSLIPPYVACLSVTMEVSLLKGTNICRRANKIWSQDEVQLSPCTLTENTFCPVLFMFPSQPCVSAAAYRYDWLYHNFYVWCSLTGQPCYIWLKIIMIKSLYILNEYLDKIQTQTICRRQGSSSLYKAVTKPKKCQLHSIFCRKFWLNLTHRTCILNILKLWATNRSFSCGLDPYRIQDKAVSLLDDPATPGKWEPTAGVLWLH